MSAARGAASDVALHQLYRLFCVLIEGGPALPTGLHQGQDDSFHGFLPYNKFTDNHTVSYCTIRGLACSALDQALIRTSRLSTLLPPTTITSRIRCVDDDFCQELTGLLSVGTMSYVCMSYLSMDCGVGQ